MMIDDIRRITGVAYVTDKVRETRLKRYRHMQRQEDDCAERILEPRKTEEKMDRYRQVRSGEVTTHGGGRRGSC